MKSKNNKNNSACVAGMKSHGMLFSGPMVRALLAGIKWQTRRGVSARNSLLDGSPVAGYGRVIWERLDWSRAYVEGGPSPAGNAGPYWHVPAHGVPGMKDETWHRIYPRIQAGDEVWVKETFFPVHKWKHEPIFAAVQPDWIYRADYDYWEKRASVIGGHKWSPSILMPRVSSRITLAVPAVRTERLSAIDERDALAEGIDIFADGAGFKVTPGGAWQRNPEDAYRALWESINGPDSWAVNPPVWVYELKRRAG